MSTKACKKCGWIYPITQPGNTCKVCGELFDVVVCRTCGDIVSGTDKVPKLNLCKKCHNEAERRHMVKYNEKRNKQHADQYADWLAKVKQVPTDYPTLTEEQWMEACRHFGGCAQCGDENIEARGFFIAFKEGGRYCDWNIIPMCDKCAADWKLCPNPFRTAWMRDNIGRAFNRRKCLTKIVSYLGGKLDDAARAAGTDEASKGDSQ